MRKGNASNVTVTELPGAITTTGLTETIAMASPTEATEGRLPVVSVELPNLTRTKRIAVKLRQIERGLIEKSVVFPPSATGEMIVNAIGIGTGTVTVKVLEIKTGIGTRNVIESEIETAATALGGEVAGYIAGIARPAAAVAPRGVVASPEAGPDASVVILLDLRSVLDS